MSPAQLKRRLQIERRIGKKVVECALAAGYSIGVDNGGDEEEYRGTDRKRIIKEMFATDEEHVIFYDQRNSRVGWVYLVYGNDGWDVISDYTTNLESVIQPGLDLARKLEEQYA